MGLRIILTALLLFSLAACSSANQSSTEDNNSTSDDSRELTDEEQKYIDFLLDEDYKALISMTENQESEIKKDYYHLASALQLFEEVEKRKKDSTATNEELELRYSTVLQKLRVVKYIPTEISDKVKEVKKLSQFQKDFYANKQL
ncbi:hypothetical protein [Niallia oryzisoli]|uniref:hypothetical protein n=1 Tax=Niallia oryzisoli TaxID=1737571 RepID=UPI003735B0FE